MLLSSMHCLLTIVFEVKNIKYDTAITVNSVTMEYIIGVVHKKGPAVSKIRFCICTNIARIKIFITCCVIWQRKIIYDRMTFNVLFREPSFSSAVTSACTAGLSYKGFDTNPSVYVSSVNTCSFAPGYFSFTETSTHIGFELGATIGRMRNVLRRVCLALDAQSPSRQSIRHS